MGNVYRNIKSGGVILKIVLIVKLCIVLYLAIMTHWIVFRMLKENKYGRAIFKINSLTYKKGSKGKKDYSLKVAPFIQNNKIYLPIREVAKVLGYKGITKEESHLFIINRFYKKIIINNDENIIILIRGAKERGYKLRGESKKIDNELMVSIDAIADIFNIHHKINKDGEILLK